MDANKFRKRAFKSSNLLNEPCLHFFAETGAICQNEWRTAKTWRRTTIYTCFGEMPGNQSEFLRDLLRTRCNSSAKRQEIAWVSMCHVVTFA